MSPSFEPNFGIASLKLRPVVSLQSQAEELGGVPSYTK